MLLLSELTKIFRIYNLSPKKFLGQHFLIDKNIQKKIISICQLSPKDIVLEIGPGLGALTEEICKRVSFVYAVEKDATLCKILKERLIYFKNLEIINSDILKFSLPPAGCSSSVRLKVIGNLPYYISTPILNYLIENQEYIDSVFISLQKELVERIVARPGGKEYGALTVFVNFYTKPQIVFPIKRTCFFPKPEVDSYFLRIEFIQQPIANKELEKLFFQIVHTAFQKRRKTILNALSESKLGFKKEILEEILRISNIPFQRRPETLSIDDFINLAKQLYRINLGIKSYLQR
ncbi:MAG: 16S rRNA (adenine(1518)-N(6)/adenine(1519)-N(6))-dimethyltransferase RsmA [Candidatus Omnitrophota bacterium]